MKFSIFITFVALMSCAHRGPSSLNGQPYAEDNVASGNVKASATKDAHKDDVCFDITVDLKNVDQNLATSSNWTAAWVDRANNYHLLDLNQRDPASAPKGGRVAAQYGEYTEWSNTFRACASKAKMYDVRSLVLTPKSMPHKTGDGLHLNFE